MTLRVKTIIWERHYYKYVDSPSHCDAKSNDSDNHCNAKSNDSDSHCNAKYNDPESHCNAKYNDSESQYIYNKSNAQFSLRHVVSTHL